MNKRLGQHFLINKFAIKKIVAALNLKANDTIIEIGPGKGALTFPLLEECQKLNCKIIGVEKDPELVNKLESYKVKKFYNFEIINGDALKILPDYKLQTTGYKLIGNIPYYITGKLLRILSELENKPKLIVLTIQREVAERITAKQGEMNLLAAAVQVWAEAEIIGYLKPSDFSPPPKVESAIIKLATRIQPLVTRDGVDDYYKIIKILFKQPRKTLLNNLSAGLKI